MKRISLLLFSYLLLTFGALGQSPDAFNYQAVARDLNGDAIANSSVGLEFLLHQASPGGIVVYSETHIPTTNDHGVFAVIIGNGTPTAGAFSDVDWRNGPYFLEVGLDPAGGSSYISIGTQQLVSVPYALYADQTECFTVSQQGDTLYQDAYCYVIIPGISAANGGCADVDGDGFFNQANCGTAVDCDDNNSAINPGAVDVCDGIDNNCDNQTDDGDPLIGTPCGSTVGACIQGVWSCVNGTLTCVGGVEPSPEVCDGVDNDCNGIVDEGNPGGGAACGGGSGVGVCQPGVLTCVSGVLTCVGEVLPSPEVCDGLDNDCDGIVDEDFNLSSDASNCGSCGNICPPGFVCNGGSCQCSPGTINCGGQCVDTNTDPFNCGGCANVCTFPNAQAICNNGSCQLGPCDPGFADCDGNPANGCETNLSTSTSNCGACGNACPAGSICVSGSCQCPPGTVNCAGQCVDTNTDPSNCGACGNFCSFPNAQAICNNGSCQLGPCDPGFADCDGNPANGCETNLSTDASNCGACGNACPAGAVCVGGSCQCPPGTVNCAGQCVDTSTDPSNCGACGNDCPPGFQCQNGSCVQICPPAGTSCDDGNLCTSGDVEDGNCNCIGTPIVCDDGNPCTSDACNPATGQCVFTPLPCCTDGVLNGNETDIDCGGPDCPPCTTGQNCFSGTDCQSPDLCCNGTCTDIQSDVNNCGACGVACPPGYICNNGSCQCPPGTVDCGGQCADVNNDPQNCGACNNPCFFPNAQALCNNGSCQLGPCDSGFADCDGNPANGCETNLITDNSNCGACGNACPPGFSCQGGACVSN